MLDGLDNVGLLLERALQPIDQDALQNEFANIITQVDQIANSANFNGLAPYRGSSEHLKLTERFTPLGPDTLEWSVTFEDPHTWERPWTFAMNLIHDESQPLFEYACHEGNYGLANILSAARAEEAAAKKK